MEGVAAAAAAWGAMEAAVAAAAEEGWVRQEASEAAVGVASPAVEGAAVEAEVPSGQPAGTIQVAAAGGLAAA